MKAIKRKLYDEKEAEMSCYSMEVFNINIASRYGKANEIAEMIEFCRLAYREGVNQFIKNIDCDSKANLVSFEFNLHPGTGNFDIDYESELKIQACARKSFRSVQVLWGGGILDDGTSYDEDIDQLIQTWESESENQSSVDIIEHEGITAQFMEIDKDLASLYLEKNKTLTFFKTTNFKKINNNN